MLVGKVLGARFALQEKIEHDVPAVERFLARDERLDRATVVDVVHSTAPGAVRKVATRASRLRDPRLARVVATGKDEVEGTTVTYIASELVPGARLDQVLAERRLDPRRAVAAVGGAARALAAARAEDLHHGWLRPAAITVTDRGRVVVSGVGVDAEAAGQAGVSVDPSESGDAAALAHILVRSLTGLDASEATVADLPESLASRPRRLVTKTLEGEPPTSLDQVIVALSPFDSRALVGFSSVWPVLDLTPAKERERLEQEEREAALAEERRQERLAATREMLDEETIPAAASAAAAAVAAEHASADLQDALRELDEALAQEPPGTGATTEPEAGPDGAALPPGAAVQPDGPADKYEAGFDTLEIMVASQNRRRSESTWELVLGRLARRWPGSRSVARSLERAQERANSGGPLDGSRVVVLLAIVGVVVAVMIAWRMLAAPLDPSITIEVDPSGATIAPSVSADPEASTGASATNP